MLKSHLVFSINRKHTVYVAEMSHQLLTSGWLCILPQVRRWSGCDSLVCQGVPVQRSHAFPGCSHQQGCQVRTILMNERQRFNILCLTNFYMTLNPYMRCMMFLLSVSCYWSDNLLLCFSLIVSEESVLRDQFYNGNVKTERGTENICKTSCI